MNNIQPQYIDEDGVDHRPVIINVGNFNKPTADAPSLLSMDDVGKTWSEESVVCNLPDCGNVPEGKGLDQNGNMLLWIRHAGGKHPVYLRHELYAPGTRSPIPTPISTTERSI